MGSKGGGGVRTRGGCVARVARVPASARGQTTNAGRSPLSLSFSLSHSLSLSLVQMEKTHAYTHTLSLYLLSLLLYFCPSPLPSQDLKIHSGGNTREIHLKQRGKEEDRGERVRVSEGGK